MKLLVIIPARYGSTRLPGKPLMKIGAYSLVQRVFLSVATHPVFVKGNNMVVVATDSDKIADDVKQVGGRAVMTPVVCPTGTDRCWFAYQLMDKKYGPFERVINVQGDMADLRSAMLDPLLTCDLNDITIATVYKRCRDNAGPGVYLTMDRNNLALYFSRALIPHNRDGVYNRHVGLYAFSPEALSRFGLMLPSRLEELEGLEQLRWLEAGYLIKCLEVGYDGCPVDTPKDFENAVRWIEG